jgi:hypothetical protein
MLEEVLETLRLASCLPEPESPYRLLNPKTRGPMRSELVYSAGIKIANRFLLATVAIKAVRKLHISTTRTEDTANVVFVDVAAGRYTDVCMPEILPQAAIESLIVDPFVVSAA